VVRKRNEMLDVGYRTSSETAARVELRRDQLAQLEAVFGEPSEEGMSKTLDEFFNAWSDLAATPTSIGARAVVQQRGRQVATLFNTYDGELTSQRATATDRLQQTLRQINSLAQQVADLNGRILSSESSGMPNNDLRDRRDLALDQLAGLAGARVEKQANGDAAVLVGSFNLVEGTNAQALELGFAVSGGPAPAEPVGDVPVRIKPVGNEGTVMGLGGEVHALMESINGIIPELRTRLDANARLLTATVNTLHRTGFLFDGSTIPGAAAGDFFDPGTVTAPVRAGTISLDAGIAADAGRIAASQDANGPADNRVANQLASLRDLPTSVTWTSTSGAVERGSFIGFFRSTVTQLGIASQATRDDATLFRTLADQAEARRQDSGGVNIDEEMVQIVRVQQAYQAAAKMVKSVDELMQTIMQLI
jgi:flagellar hook-associated protein 1 FlgK